jgi:hypothetical protein
MTVTTVPQQRRHLLDLNTAAGQSAALALIAERIGSHNLTGLPHLNIYPDGVTVQMLTNDVSGLYAWADAFGLPIPTAVRRYDATNGLTAWTQYQTRGECAGLMLRIWASLHNDACICPAPAGVGCPTHQGEVAR